MISLHGVRKSFDGNEVVRELNLHIEKGEFVVLLGESGCGKTTTLKMVNRLIEPNAGTVKIGGQDIATQDPIELRRRIGYVLQRIALFPHFTVAQNISIVPRLLGWDAKQCDARVNELLELVQLPADEFRDRLPKELSGGQRQRVGVARAVAARPEIVLMDEPFGAIDPLTRADLQAEYKNIHESLGLTTLMVTHDMLEACLLADRICVLERGTVVQAAPPVELLTQPATPYVERLMASPRKQAQILDELLRGSRAP